ncbi:hypothetical protein HZB00_00145, partial [Candidatus Woesearchaeota archaeon]|nr:hypothetical protein [Candidatus Woesearchaeota archaeon]
MDIHIKQDILDVLDHALAALQRDDMKALKELSNMTIHNASIHQDQYSIVVAVLIYTLSKLFERSKYEQYASWNVFSKDCLEKLRTAREALLHDEFAQFDSLLKEYMHALENTDKNIRKYIQDVLLNAKINKASRLYEHGISLGRTAELLSITQYELMDYVGKTYIADVKENITIS